MPARATRPPCPGTARFLLMILLLALMPWAGLVHAQAAEPSSEHVPVIAPPERVPAEEDAARRARLTPLRGTEPAQWRIVWTTNPAREATVSWSTAQAGERHTIYYDTRPHAGRLASYAHRQDAQQNAPYADGPQDLAPELHYHHARLTDLEPDTVYYFVLVSDADTSRELHFRTAPMADIPLRLIYTADDRTNADRRRRINELISRLAAEDPHLLAIAHGGDYVNTGRRLDQWSEWLSDFELTTTEHGRVLPIIPGRGDHEADRGSLYDTVFDSPGDSGWNYYAINLGPQVLFVTLDYRAASLKPASGRRQAQFLRESLERHATVRWQVAMYHTPIYPAVKTPATAARDAWLPWFEKYDLDLACEADGHLIKRTFPLRGGAVDPTGVTYIGEGGGGALQRIPRDDLPYLAKAGYGDHIFLLDFGHSRLKLKVILADASVFDEHDLPARSRNANPASATPATSLAD